MAEEDKFTTIQNSVDPSIKCLSPKNDSLPKDKALHLRVPGTPSKPKPEKSSESKPNIRGPRCIKIQRSSAGFGFTLRHFIVYPPDSVSDCPEEWHRGMSAGLLDPMTPMDTIFVKHVRENGPAAQAGLATGDQVVSVNGESVISKTYAQVVQMIQKSGSALKLIVMPKEHDVLQQCFADTAHNPQTNPRPSSSVTYQPNPILQSIKTNLDPVKTNSFSHLPRPKPYQPFKTEPAKASAAVTTSPEMPPAPLVNSSFQGIPGSLPVVNRTMEPLLLNGMNSLSARSTFRDDRLDGTQSKMTAVAVVSNSVRKAADFNPINSSKTNSTSLYPNDSRSRSSLAEYSPNIIIPVNSKRSSYAGTPTSKSDFILNLNPSPSGMLSYSRVEPSSTSVGTSTSAAHLTRDLVENIEDTNHGLSTRRPSLSSSKGSIYSEDRSPSDQVITRIKKSFEQKEEFLNRPTLPYWVNTEVQTPPIPKEFYGQPQKFAKPLWPPKTNHESSSEIKKEANSLVQRATMLEGKSPLSLEKNIVERLGTPNSEQGPVYSPRKGTSDSPIMSPTAYMGLVPNSIPKPFYGSPTSFNSGKNNYISTLSRIQENILSDGSGDRRDLELKLNTSSLHAPLASPEEFTPSPSKPTSNALLRSNETVAVVLPESVSKRAKQFESGALNKSPTSPNNLRAELNILGEKGLLSRIAQRRQEPDGKVDTVSCINRSEIPVVEAIRPGSGNRTVIVGSGKLHCEPPSDSKSNSGNNDQLSGNRDSEAIRKTVLRQHSYRSAVRAFNSSNASVQENDVSQNVKLTTATERLQVTEGPLDSITALVNRRKKIYHDDDNDRSMRRVSYRKATANDRQNVDSDVEASENEADQLASTTPLNTEQLKNRITDSRSHSPSIQKLRFLFGEKGHSVKTGVVQHSNSGGNLSFTVDAAPNKEDLPSPCGSDITRDGWLHIKQTIVDSKRSSDRSWRQVWTKLRCGHLYFYKDKKDSGHLVPSVEELRPSTIDLRGCNIDIALDYTKRKHVLRLTTPNGTNEYLFQCEDNNDMILWLQTLQEHASGKGTVTNTTYSASEMVLRKQAADLDNSVHSQNAKGIRKLAGFHRNRSPTGHSPVSKTRKPSLGGEPPSSPNKSKTWKGKMEKQFKKMRGNFPNNSPHSPLPEGATIGVPLEVCPRSSFSENVPLIVELCVGIVEARGLETVGVYRVPGNTAAVTSLTEMLNKGFDGLNHEDPRWNDVNVISSLLKSFFRKLPDPLVTSELYSLFISASKHDDEEIRAKEIKRLVDDLPEPHYSTLRYLVGHLSKVAKKSAINKMEARNLAIVFGPTLMRTTDDNTVAMVNDMSHHCRIVETLIEKADWFFPEAKYGSNEKNLECQDNNGLGDGNSERNAITAKEIVSAIILAASRKRNLPGDSPDVNRRSADKVDRVDGDRSAIDSLPKSGSSPSLIEMGSTGVPLALPAEVAILRNKSEIIPERKRSASIGGDICILNGVSNRVSAELNSIAESLDGQTTEFRPRTSSGNFTMSVHPIDAAGIRSYSGLNAVTQERIRRFEQETKALLQRDQPRQRRDADTCRSNRAHTETLERKSNPEEANILSISPVNSPVNPEKTLGVEHQETLEQQKVDNLAEHATSVASKDLDVVDDPSGDAHTCPQLILECSDRSEQLEVLESNSDTVNTNIDCSTEQISAEEISERSGRLSEIAIVGSNNDNSKSPADFKTRKTSPVGTVPKPVKALINRSQIPKLTLLKSSDTSTYRSSSTVASSSKSAAKPSTQSIKTVRLTHSSQKTKAADSNKTKKYTEVKNNKQPSASTNSVSATKLGPTKDSLATAKNGRSRIIDKPQQRPPNAGGQDVEVNDETESELLQSITSNLNPMVRGFLNTDDHLHALSGSDISNGTLGKDYRNPSLHRVQGEEEKVVLKNVAGNDGKLAMKRPVEPKGNDIKVKRSDSLTKDEKTESNNKARERERLLTNGRTKKFFQRGENGLKRRHTVGGTRDFDKVRIQWLATDNKDCCRQNEPSPRCSAWERLQPLVSNEHLNVDRSLKTWLNNERLRTSSPELCRRSETGAAFSNVTVTDNEARPILE